MKEKTGLPKETNSDVPNVQKRANIFVKSATLVFIQIVLRIFISKDCNIMTNCLKIKKKKIFFDIAFFLKDLLLFLHRK